MNCKFFFLFLFPEVIFRLEVSIRDNRVTRGSRLFLLIILLKVALINERILIIIQFFVQRITLFLSLSRYLILRFFELFEKSSENTYIFNRKTK